MKQKRDWATAKKALACIGLAVAVIGFFGYSWWRSLNVTPVLNIPTPQMPNPNARDVYIKACNGIVDGNKIGYAIGRRHSGQGDDRPYSLAEKAALVKENEKALQTLREGFDYEYREPPVRSNFTPELHYAKFREMARLKMLEAQVRSAQGDWNGAMNSHLDTIYFGQEVPRGATLIGQLVGIAIQAIGRKSAGEPIAHLDAKQARGAAQRMETILAHHVPNADVLQEEKWFGLSALIEMFSRPDWRGSWHDVWGGGEDENGDGSEESRGRVQRIREALQLYFVNKREVINNYTGYMDQAIAGARQPYAANLPPPPVPNDPINQVFLPVFAQARQKDVQAESANASLLLALALRAYRAEHGRYPAKLEELVPVYLSKLPDDPMALQGSFGYQRDDRDSYTLFSKTGSAK
jgi:hypothetical protein